MMFVTTENQIKVVWSPELCVLVLSSGLLNEKQKKRKKKTHHPCDEKNNFIIQIRTDLAFLIALVGDCTDQLCKVL